MWAAHGRCMSKTRKQSLCTYLLQTIVAALIGAAVLPVLQAIASAAVAEANRRQPYLSSLHRRQEIMKDGLILIACLFLLIPVYLVALVQYWQA